MFSRYRIGMEDVTPVPVRTLVEPSNFIVASLPLLVAIILASPDLTTVPSAALSVSTLSRARPLPIFYPSYFAGLTTDE